jgi:adenylate cyclase
VKKNLIRIALGLIIVLLFLGHAGKWYEVPLLARLENIVYDTRLTLTMPRTVDPRIVIVDIDEKSLAERELRDDTQFVSTLRNLRPALDYDAIFAASMHGRRIILGYPFTNDPGRKGALPDAVLPAGTFAGRPIGFVRFEGYAANLPELQKAATGAGHFNPYTDPDGLVRRVPMLVEHDGAYYEPLSLAVVRALVNEPRLEPGYPAERMWSRGYAGLEWLAVGALRIPVDDNVTALVPYRGHKGSFPYVSASDVIHDRVAPELMKGRIVLVGTTAPGLLDLRATPVEPVFPGVEIHANLIAGILDQNLKQRPPYVMGAEFILLLASGLAMALLLPLLTPLKSLLVTVFALAVVVVFNVVVFHFGNLVLPLASGITMIGLLFALNMSYGYFVEARGKRQITGLFGQYVPPELVDEMAKNPEHFSMEGESREMTVLFSDVRGFTTISEGLEPRELSQLMNEFLTPLTEVIYRHRGTIDKYMGDAIMAFWGAPLPDPLHPRHAVLAALGMQAALRRLAPQFRARGWPEIRIGVGLNSGRMSVGNMGSKVRLAYTVMGDAVNLASRLEGITKQYGVDIIVGENTRNAVPDVVFREIDRVRVKGKDVAVAIYEPLGLAGEVDQAQLDEIKVFGQALRLYRAQDWDRAELQMINLQQRHPEVQLYSVYLERIAALRARPPGSGWDGAWNFETK